MFARTLKVPVAIAAAGVAGLSMALAAWAGSARQSGPSVAETFVNPPSATGKHAQLAAPLVEVARAERTSGGPAAARAALREGLELSGGLVHVEVLTSRPGPVAAALEASGGRVVRTVGSLIEAFVAPGALERLAGVPEVRLVDRPNVGVPDAIPGEGVSASGAAAWHAAGRRGAGARVAIIDNGFVGFRDRQRDGDLPSLFTYDLCGGGLETGTVHGTGAAEIVHEMAPDAQLHLVCVRTRAALAQAKEYVKQQGIPIVSHSVSWFNTSRGDGRAATIAGDPTPEATVADARANNVLWVNSAGNRAQQHWSGTFADLNNDLSRWHDFAANDIGNTIGVPTGADFCAYLKWDSWPTTGEDYDLHLARSSDGVIVASGQLTQNGSLPPTEMLCYQHAGPAANFYLGVWYAGATPVPVVRPRLDLFIAPGPDLEYQTAATSVTEPGSSPSAFTVGAICWLTSAYEVYSSQGPTIDGRIKPDIAGQTSVSNGAYGFASGCNGGFSGTSAATPHVAGAAALVKGAFPAASATDVQQFLESRAGDLGPPSKDSIFGFGRLALGAAPGAPTPPAPLPPAPRPPTPPPPPPPVARSPQAVVCRVPNLRGRTLRAAQRSLRAARCRLGRVTRRFSVVRRGRVIAQSPRAGRRLAVGSRVKVVVSRGRRR